MTFLFGAMAVSCLAEDLQEKLQSRLTEMLQKGGYPGLTAALALPDGQVLTASAGWADAGHTIPMKPSHQMYAGSVGKMFVAAVILQAVDEGALDLDSRIERWIGREPWFSRLPNGCELTLRLLLSHRSGVPEHTDNRAFVKALATGPDRKWTPLELVSYTFDRKPPARPGMKYFYTDTNYLIAGLVFETATGRKLFDEIDRRIVKPLGLTETVPNEQRILENLARGQMNPRNPLGLKGETIRDGRQVVAYQAEYAGGGLVSTPADLVRWAKQLFEGRVLSARQLGQMLDGKPSERNAKYGLGVSIVPSEAGPVYGHDGWTFGYRTQLAYFPNYRVAAAVQTNSDPGKFKVPLGTVLGRVAGVVLADKLPKKTQP